MSLGAGLCCHHLATVLHVAKDQHLPALLLSERGGGKGRRGHTEVFPYLNSAWGIPQSPGALTEGGEEERGELQSWSCPVPIVSGRSEGRETRRATRVPFTRVPALPCSPAPAHTDMHHAGTHALRPGAARRDACAMQPGSSARCEDTAAPSGAGSLVVSPGLCVVSGMASREKAGAQAACGSHLSFRQGSLWEGAWPGFLPHGSSVGLLGGQQHLDPDFIFEAAGG